MADLPIFCNNCGGHKSGGYTSGRKCKCELESDTNIAISKQKRYETHGRYERQTSDNLSLRDLVSLTAPKPKPKKKNRPKLSNNPPRIS